MERFLALTLDASPTLRTDVHAQTLAHCDL